MSVSWKKFSWTENERHTLWKKFSRIKPTRKSSEKKWTYKKSEDFFYMFTVFNFQKWVREIIRTFQINNAVSQFCFTWNKLVKCRFSFIMGNIKNISVKESSKTHSSSASPSKLVEESSINFEGDDGNGCVYNRIS